MLNYFELFGLPVRYKIDENALTKVYLQKQREHHPDNSGDDVLSSQLNVAYSVLRDPLQRAEYIVRLQGRNSDSMPNDLALRMFSMRGEFEKINDQLERRIFLEKMSNRVDELIRLMEDLNEQQEKFFTTFCEAKFIRSFLEKVQSYGYDRN